MASLRQLNDGFYLAKSEKGASASVADLRSLLTSVQLDFERRLSTKLFDVNRTLTALCSEKRRHVVVDNVPQIVFERALKADMGGLREFQPQTLEELLRVVPANSVVRRHYACDFSLIVPLYKCAFSFSNTSLVDSPHPPLSPRFFAEPQEIFVPLQSTPSSPRVLEVVSPFPGAVAGDSECVGIDPTLYPIVNLSCGGESLFFPPLIDPAPESPSETVELRGIQRGDKGAYATPGELSPGTLLLVRDHVYRVEHVTGGGKSWEVYVWCRHALF